MDTNMMTYISKVYKPLCLTACVRVFCKCVHGMCYSLSWYSYNGFTTVSSNQSAFFSLHFRYFSVCTKTISYCKRWLLTTTTLSKNPNDNVSIANIYIIFRFQHTILPTKVSKLIRDISINQHRKQEKKFLLIKKKVEFSFAFSFYLFLYRDMKSIRKCKALDTVQATDPKTKVHMVKTPTSV